jgi:hypothetical protein
VTGKTQWTDPAESKEERQSSEGGGADEETSGGEKRGVLLKGGSEDLDAMAAEAEAEEEREAAEHSEEVFMERLGNAMYSDYDPANNKEIDEIFGAPRADGDEGEQSQAPSLEEEEEDVSGMLAGMDGEDEEAAGLKEELGWEAAEWELEALGKKRLPGARPRKEPGEAHARWMRRRRERVLKEAQGIDLQKRGGWRNKKQGAKKEEEEEKGGGGGFVGIEDLADLLGVDEEATKEQRDAAVADVLESAPALPLLQHSAATQCPPSPHPSLLLPLPMSLLYTPSRWRTALLPHG